MATAPKAGRFGLSSIADARDLARALDKRLVTLAPAIETNAVAFLQRLRGYLLKQDRRIGTRHNIEQIVKYDQGPDGTFQIFLGPTIDKGNDESFFRFPSGARLSFSIALRRQAHGCELISYRFQFTFPDKHSPEFIRIDLRNKSHSDPLAEPLAHIHPGMRARLPCAPLTPTEVLDRIFFVLDPNTRP
jgi:hypothetical protein